MSRLELASPTEVTPVQASPTLELGERFHLRSFGSAELVKPIEFSPSLADAVTRGQQSGKPVVVIFEEDNCGWCKRFDAELGKQAAASLSDQAIFVKVSPSKDPQAAALAKSLGVDSYPTVSVLNVSGNGINERTRMIGYMTADDFASRFRDRGQTQIA